MSENPETKHAGPEPGRPSIVPHIVPYIVPYIVQYSAPALLHHVNELLGCAKSLRRGDGAPSTL